MRREASRGVAALQLRTRLYRALSHLPPRVCDALIEGEMRLRMRLGAPVKLVPEEALTATCVDALQLLIARNGREGLGDYLEFGVYAGTSMRCMFRALRRLDLDEVRLFGFDSFVGLPASAASDDEGYWTPGMFKSDAKRVAAMLERDGLFPDRGILIEGWFDDTLTPGMRETLGIRKASVIMMDADMYTSTKTALEFCLPLIEADAVVFFAMTGGPSSPKRISARSAPWMSFLRITRSSRLKSSTRTSPKLRSSYASVGTHEALAWRYVSPVTNGHAVEAVPVPVPVPCGCERQV